MGSTKEGNKIVAVVKLVKENWFSLLRQVPFIDIFVILVGIALALALRYSLRTFESLDIVNYERGWYETIKNQGFAALEGDFSNYTPPYLYLLYGVTLLLPEVATVSAVKLPSIAFDFICAWYVYKIVRLKYSKGPLPLFAFFAILFAPTVILNGAFWGQIDSIYTAALIAFIFYLLKKQNWLACIAFGIAFSVKFQSIYLAPFLLAYFLRKGIAWKHLIAIPLVYFLTIIPAWIAGRPLWELLTIYVGQVEGYQGLVHNAPNMYVWLPSDMYNLLYTAGIIFAVSICLLYILAIIKSRVRIAEQLIIQLALVSALIVPFFLPKTHDRYFYSADVLSIVYGFYFPEYFYIPLVANMVSFFIYQPFLFNVDIIPQPVLALILFVAIIIVIRQMMLILFKKEN